MIENTSVQKENSTRRTLTARVVSDKMNKTIVVEVARQVKHPKYNKYIVRNSKLHVHDEKNQCKVGDTVIVEECRPVSKKKSWRLVEIIN